MSSRKPQLLRAPVAVATDGTLLLNVHMTTDADTPDAALDEAIKTGRSLFIGVALTDREADALLEDLDDGVADTTARLAPSFFAGLSTGGSKTVSAGRPSSSPTEAAPDAAPRSSAPSRDRPPGRARRR